MSFSEEQLEQLDDMLEQTVVAAEKAIEKVVNGNFPKHIAQFDKNLYDEYVKQGFDENFACMLVQRFDTAGFLGQKRT
jgi:hypothetical protein